MMRHQDSWQSEAMVCVSVRIQVLTMKDKVRGGGCGAVLKFIDVVDLVSLGIIEVSGSYAKLIKLKELLYQR
ncbi:hypothetical protein QVD17_09469 [Tagetes erecta]|uniref:Uncharacterized protein n=1 Tax=Tagetes erecta TaxID=13708 RepID=A0AAD8P5B4_TARER|nr:hypothetical protein QVD17_09469 [Tagetes erecta]